MALGEPRSTWLKACVLEEVRRELCGNNKQAPHESISVQLAVSIPPPLYTHSAMVRVGSMGGPGQDCVRGHQQNALVIAN